MANVSSSNGIEKCPKLRFPEFTESWSQVKLSDFTERVMRKNKNNDTDLPLTISSKDGLVDQITFFNKTVASKDMSGYYLLLNGEFAYNKSYSVGFDFGSIKRLERYPMGALSTLYICFSLTKHNSDYIKTYFDSLKWYKEIYMISAEGARNHGLLNVPTDEFFDTYHYITESKEEQVKIARLMELVEQRIKKQQAMVDNLKKYKRGVVKALLSPKSNSNGNVVWKTDAIGNLGTFIKGAPLSKADISDGGTPFILYGELYTTYKEVVRTIVRKTQANVDAVYLSKVGDVVIPTSGETPEEISTASCIMVPNVILAGDLNIYRSQVVDGRIMSYLLNHIVNDQIARVAQGKSVVHVQASEIGKILITYPDSREQNRIAKILELIDDRITMSECVLIRIQNMKKALLQQLFI